MFGLIQEHALPERGEVTGNLLSADSKMDRARCRGVCAPRGCGRGDAEVVSDPGVL